MSERVNSIVTTRLTTISRPNEYLGNVKHIPVYFTGDYAASDTLVLTEVLPQNTKLVAIHLTNTAMGGSAAIDIGYTGAATAIIAAASVVSAGTVNYQGVAVDVSEKRIIGVVNAEWASGTISGYILVVTDQ